MKLFRDGQTQDGIVERKCRISFRKLKTKSQRMSNRSRRNRMLQTTRSMKNLKQSSKTQTLKCSRSKSNLMSNLLRKSKKGLKSFRRDSKTLKVAKTSNKSWKSTNNNSLLLRGSLQSKEKKKMTRSKENLKVVVLRSKQLLS